MEKVNAVGRRKAAVARVIVSEGNGNIVINKRPLEVYFPSSILQFIVKQPLSVLDVTENMTSRSTLTAAATKDRPKLFAWLSPALSSRSTPMTSQRSAPMAS